MSPIWKLDKKLDFIFLLCMSFLKWIDEISTFYFHTHNCNLIFYKFPSLAVFYGSLSFIIKANFYKDFEASEVEFVFYICIFMFMQN
jgi:hypothetical protein